VEELHQRLHMSPENVKALLSVADDDGPGGVLEEVTAPGGGVFGYVAAAEVESSGESVRLLDVAHAAAETDYEPSAAGASGCCGGLFTSKRQM